MTTPEPRRYYVDHTSEGVQLIMVDDTTGQLLTSSGWAPYPFSLSVGMGEGGAEPIDEAHATEIARSFGHDLPAAGR